MTVNRHKVFCGDGENFLELDSGNDYTTLGWVLKTTGVYTLKGTSFSMWIISQ